MKNEPKIFKFAGWNYSVKNKVAEFNFRYSFVFGDKHPDLNFTDKIFLNLNGAELNKINKNFLENILSNLHLALGISYYKLYCSKNIEIENNFLTKEQAKFWNTFYTKGLGELYYKNKIDFRGLINFPYKNQNKAAPHFFKPENKSLLLFGGGKDSLLSLEFLRELEKKFSVYTLNAVPLQLKLIKSAKINNLNIKHKLDQKLFELSKTKGVYNGHIPISAIYGFSALLVATVLNYKYIIFSNEKSANYGNVNYLGVEINHQWDKTFEYEKMFFDYVHKFISPELTPFSLLRPFSEVEIVWLFVNSPNFKIYKSKFSSCNKNFKLSENARLKEKIWCGECPKCAFVFALFAAFLPKETILKIFGKNLYKNTLLLPTFREILGIKGIKPFECVGTSYEMKWAMHQAYLRGVYENDPAIRMFKKEILSKYSSHEIGGLAFDFLPISKKHLAPKEFKEVLDKNFLKKFMGVPKNLIKNYEIKRIKK